MSALEAVGRVEAFRVSVPTVTLSTAPLTTDVSFPPGEVVGIEIIIPPGHAGETGIRIAQNQQAIIPATAGSWIEGDDDTIRWPLAGFINSGDWQVIAYNEDVFAHSFFVRFLISEEVTEEEREEIPIPIIFP